MARARAREDGQRSPRAERPGGSVATLWPPQPANTEPSSTPRGQSSLGSPDTI